jgi:hypothetical protein
MTSVPPPESPTPPNDGEAAPPTGAPAADPPAPVTSPASDAGESGVAPSIEAPEATSPAGPALPPPPAYPAPPRPSSGPRAGGLAIAALVVGIAAFVFGLAPGLGILIGGTAVVLGIVALVKGARKGFPVTGIILGALGVLASIATTIALIVGLSLLPTIVERSASASPQTLPSATPRDEASVAPGAGAVPTGFDDVDAAVLADIVADPDGHVGEKVVVYGFVSQFDEATGPCLALLGVGAAQSTSSWDYPHDVIGGGGDGITCPTLEGVLEGDHLKLWVTVAGSYTYGAVSGEDVSAPAFDIAHVELLEPLTS